MPKCDLSIIIVSWNVRDLLESCLRSIAGLSRPQEEAGLVAGRSTGSPPDASALGLRTFGPAGQPQTLEVIVVDNASTDGTVAQVQTHFPWVEVIASSENVGFSRGNNLGYTRSRGRFVYFLNPDTELVQDPSDGNSLWRLFTFLRDDPSVGVVGPQLRYGDGQLQSSRRRFPTPLSGFFESTWLGRLWAHNPWARRMHMDDCPIDSAHDVDWLVGAALLGRRDAFEEVRMAESEGPFNEGFFMYSEELDLCRRIKAAGWRIVFVPQALVIHYEGRSSQQVVAARHIHFNTSKVRYYRGVFGLRWSEWLRRYLLAEFRCQLLVEQLKWLLGHKRALRATRIAAYRAVLASRLLPKR